MKSAIKLLFLLLIVPTTVVFHNYAGVAHAVEEDAIEDEVDEEAVVEDEDVSVEEDVAPDLEKEEDEEEEEEVEDRPLRASPKAVTRVLFVSPQSTTDLPAGKPVTMLIGFANRGDKDFVVDSVEASFRYPQDYSYYLYNYTANRVEQVVSPDREATFEYELTPNEAFNSRSFGLVVNVLYKEDEGVWYRDAVFNQTVAIVEPNDGMDSETFFLYVFLAAVAVLIIVGIHQLISSYGKKKGSGSGRNLKQAMELGTKANGIVDDDDDWLPDQYKTNKSPRRSPRTKTSPGRKKAL